MADPVIPPIEFSDPRRARLHDQIAFLGPGPASLFRDACRVFDGLIAAETASRIAGHLQRELLSSVEDILLPLGYEEPKAGEDPKQVKALLKSLGLPFDTDTKRFQEALPKYFKPQGGNAPSKVKVIAQSLGLTFEHEIVLIARELKLHRIAHRRGLEAAPPLDEVRETWERFQRLLSLLLDHFEKSYASAYEKIRAAIAARDLDTFRAKVPQNGVTLAYFFDHVDGDDWLGLLRESDMLRIAPRGGGWPALGYLRRYAATRPAEVLEILLAVRPTQNEFVLIETIQMAKAFPPDSAVRVLAKAAAEALVLRPDSFVPDDLARTAAEYTTTHPAEVRAMLWPYLELRAATDDLKGGIGASRDLVARVDIHSYADLTSGPLQALIKSDPRRTFDALLTLFDAALITAFGAEGDPYSTLWRAAIEPHEQNHEFEPLPHLLDALRVAAETSCNENAAAASEIIRDLLGRPWTIYRRLALHLARVSLQPADPIVHQLAVDPATIEARDSRHESHLFLAKVFPELFKEEQQRVIDMMLAGPAKGKGGGDVENEDPDRVRRWKAVRLGWIEDHLPPDARRIYDELRGEASASDETSDFDFYRTAMFVGPTSPKDAVELRTASIDEIVTFLRTWTPPPGFMQATREGLARELQPVVADRAVEFSAVATRFRDLDATYVRGILAGFTDAAQKDVALSWEPILRLAEWAVGQPREIPRADRRGLDDDPHWGWARAQIGRLLRQGYRTGPAHIPLELREPVWKILAQLAADPDPAVDRDEQRDPLTTAINSTRGVAFEAIFGYAAWVRGGYFRPPEQPGAPFHDMPEFEAMLRLHLNPDIDPSLAIRAVYGQHLYLLYRLSRQWVLEHLNELAPTSENLFAALWETYLVYANRFSDDSLRDFRPLYERAVAMRADREPLYREAPRRLAHHVLHFYLHGDEPLDEGSLIDTFFRTASPDTRAYALGLVPRALHEESTPGEVSAWVERAMAFWEWRKAKTPDGADLRGFGYWMESTHFDLAWRLQELLVAVQRGGVPHAEHSVIETLAAAVSSHPLAVLEALEALIQQAAGYMDIYRLTYRGEVKQILEATIGLKDAQVRSTARAITNVLIAKGFTDLLKLLEGSE